MLYWRVSLLPENISYLKQLITRSYIEDLNFIKTQGSCWCEHVQQPHGISVAGFNIQFIDTGEKPEMKANADHLLNPDAAEHISYLQSYSPSTNRDKINLII